MTVAFNAIPSNLRVPLFWAEVDNSQANGSVVGVQRTLLLGHGLSAGMVAAGTLTLVSSITSAWALFGRGSMLARMYAAAAASDPMGEVWAVALPAPTGVAATGTITFTGPCTTAGTLSAYIAGQLVTIAVLAGDTATVVATNLAAAVNAALDLPVTATASAGVVTFLCRWLGLTGNDIDLRCNYRGLAGGEALPAGIGATIVAMSGGSGAPTMSTAISAMGDEEFDFIAMPFNDTASLAALATEMGDSAGRWSWSRQIYGHVYGAKRGTLGALVTFGGLLNDQHATIYGPEVAQPTPVWEAAASYTARNAVFIKAHPARPTQSGALDAVMPAPVGSRWTISDRQSLLGYGIATAYVSGGVQRVERAITTYQKNALGQPDTSYLDSETPHTTAYVLRYLRNRISSKYGRHLLADNGTRIAPGAPVVTPSIVAAELAVAYYELEALGIVENAALFAKYLIVERNANNPNRLDILFPPDYVNQLRIVAVLAQFRLQYPANA